MGYYTRFDMSVYDVNYNAHDIAKFMLEKSKENEAYYAFEFDLERFFENWDEQCGVACVLLLESNDGSKWYEHEEEMRDLSKEFPDVVFKLHGEGEDNEDIWDKYFMNGKMQSCPAQMTLPPFEKEKLI